MLITSKGYIQALGTSTGDTYRRLCPRHQGSIQALVTSHTGYLQAFASPHQGYMQPLVSFHAALTDCIWPTTIATTADQDQNTRPTNNQDQATFSLKAWAPAPGGLL